MEMCRYGVDRRLGPLWHEEYSRLEDLMHVGLWWRGSMERGQMSHDLDSIILLIIQLLFVGVFSLSGFVLVSREKCPHIQLFYIP